MLIFSNNYRYWTALLVGGLMLVTGPRIIRAGERNSDGPGGLPASRIVGAELTYAATMLRKATIKLKAAGKSRSALVAGTRLLTAARGALLANDLAKCSSLANRAWEVASRAISSLPRTTGTSNINITVGQQNNQETVSISVNQGAGISIKGETGIINVKAGQGAKIIRGGAGVKVKDLLKPPVMKFPAANQRIYNQREITLRWAPLPQARHYLLQVSSDPKFREIILDQRTSKTSLACTLPRDGPYFWRIRGVDEDSFKGNLAIAPFTLKTDHTPPQIRLEKPVWK